MTGEFILPTQYNYAENFNYGIGIITDDKGATYAINYQGKRISLYFKELHTYRAIIYGKKKGSKAYYQSQYTRWENTARSAYQSATNLGIRVKSNNKEAGGTYGGKLMYWNTYKSNLTKAQREMRNIRLEAQRNGHNIPQSHYETVVLVL